MSEFFFTIFTPTYNRAYKLRDLYNSLKLQSFRDFEWLIIDDGSTDDTKELVNEFISEKRINIRYIYKCNEGKHVAINIGAEKARGKWFFIVDSDDMLTEDALIISKRYCDQIDFLSGFAGVVGLRGDSKGKVWSTGNIQEGNIEITEENKKRDFIDATSVQYRYGMKIAGDRAEIIRTDILKQYKFPAYTNERFMPERYLWNQLSKDDYKFRWFNSVIYITEYLEDGLTRNGKGMPKKSPKSRASADNLSSGIKEIPFKERLFFCINYYRYGMYGKISIKELLANSEAKWIRILAFPVALLYRVK